MTTRPQRVPFGKNLLPGVIAIALFAIMASVFLTSTFDPATLPTGFEESGIVSDIGYSLLGAGEQADLPVEDFLVALILLAILLDAALDGALMLAKRDEGGEDA